MIPQKNRIRRILLTFPLVSLIPMEQARSLGLLGKEEADDEDVQHGKPKHEVGKVSGINCVPIYSPIRLMIDDPLVLLHEEVGPVADVKVGDDDAQLGHGPEEQPHVVGARCQLLSGRG